MARLPAAGCLLVPKVPCQICVDTLGGVRGIVVKCPSDARSRDDGDDGQQGQVAGLLPWRLAINGT